MNDLSSAEKPIIVTPGDPSGIGPEITLKAALSCKTPFVAIADPNHMAKLSAELGLSLDIRIWLPGQKFDKRCLFVMAHRWPAEVIAGHPNEANSSSILSAIEQAVNQALLEANFCMLRLRINRNIALFYLQTS